jgi:hypothetical protein
VLMCFQSCDPRISLEPAVQGPVKGYAEATRDGVQDATRVVAEWFEREPEPEPGYIFSSSFCYSNN